MSEHTVLTGQGIASDEARYITGEFISVDAGAHLKRLE